MSELVRNETEWRELKRVAWIRVGAIGDLVVGLASLAEMHRLFPNAKITVVGPKMWTDLLSPEVFSYVDRILVVERKKTAARAFEARDGMWHSKGEVTPLHQALSDCDGMVNTNIDSLRYGFVGVRAGLKVRVGSAPRSTAWLYTHASPYFGKDPLVHEKNVPLLLMEFAVKGLARFRHSVAQNRARLPEYVEKSVLIDRWKNEGLPSLKLYDTQRQLELTGRKAGTYVLVNPTASRREKTWPTDRLRALLLGAKSELEAKGLIQLVIGAPNETEWLKEVAHDDFAIIQPKDLQELQDVVHGARALLTNGSSMQFIAGTTKTPTLTVFGRGQPMIWGPVGRYDRIVRAKFDGSDEGSTFKGFEEEVRIYKTITIDEVREQYLKLIDAR